MTGNDVGDDRAGHRADDAHGHAAEKRMAMSSGSVWAHKYKAMLTMYMATPTSSTFLKPASSMIRPVTKRPARQPRTMTPGDEARRARRSLKVFDGVRAADDEQQIVGHHDKEVDKEMATKFLLNMFMCVPSWRGKSWSGKKKRPENRCLRAESGQNLHNTLRATSTFSESMFTGTESSARKLRQGL